LQFTIRKMMILKFIPKTN